MDHLGCEQIGGSMRVFSKLYPGYTIYEQRAMDSDEMEYRIVKDDSMHYVIVKVPIRTYSVVQAMEMVENAIKQLNEEEGWY